MDLGCSPFLDQEIEIMTLCAKKKKNRNSQRKGNRCPSLHKLLSLSSGVSLWKAMRQEKLEKQHAVVFLSQTYQSSRLGKKVPL